MFFGFRILLLLTRISRTILPGFRQNGRLLHPSTRCSQWSHSNWPSWDLQLANCCSSRCGRCISWITPKRKAPNQSLVGMFCWCTLRSWRRYDWRCARHAWLQKARVTSRSPSHYVIMILIRSSVEKSVSIQNRQVRWQISLAIWSPPCKQVL